MMDRDPTYVEASTMLGVIQIKTVNLGCIIRIYNLCFLEEFDACRHANDQASLLLHDLHQQSALHSLRVCWLVLQGY